MTWDRNPTTSAHPWHVYRPDITFLISCARARRQTSLTLPVALAGMFSWYVGARASTLHNPKTSKRQQTFFLLAQLPLLSDFFVIFPCSYHFLKKKTKWLKNTMVSKKSKACWLEVSEVSVSFYPDIHLILSR